MSITITNRKENLSAMLHGGTLNKVRNIEALFERSANTMLSKITPVDTIRTAPLTNTVHDDLTNYALPSDFRSIIDLYPQAGRTSLDLAVRNQAGKFDLTKELSTKRISIEGSEGSKVLRVNWKNRQGKILNNLDGLTNNGSWTAVGTATNLVADTIVKYSGGGSVRFDSAVSGDGIQNTTMTAVDLTTEDEIADLIIPFYISTAASVAQLTSITVLWGNDLTANYWTGVAQTAQADGTAFKLGWNIVKIPWSTATETGTVTVTAVDSVKITFATTAAISDIRVDNLIFSIGRQFDIKYYSKFIIKNTAGTWITRTTSDDDTVVLDNDAIQILLLEDLIAAAHQIEGSDSSFDIGWAKKELYGEDLRDYSGLYARYRSNYPSQAKKEVLYYGASPIRAFRR